MKNLVSLLIFDRFLKITGEPKLSSRGSSVIVSHKEKLLGSTKNFPWRNLNLLISKVFELKYTLSPIFFTSLDFLYFANYAFCL